MANVMTGAALIGGYVLGRTKKGKAALTLAAYLLRRKLDAGEMSRLVAGNPALRNLGDQVRNELFTAGKEAAASAMKARADRLADTLHERTEALRAGESVPGKVLGDDGSPDGAGREVSGGPAGRGERAASEAGASRTPSGSARKTARRSAGAAATAAKPGTAGAAEAARKTAGGAGKAAGRSTSPEVANRRRTRAESEPDAPAAPRRRRAAGTDRRDES
ncbi:hypothetical protein [Streptomyces pyxinae]|uniref:hypothetical protein n=1 Tax=Streptomyces pyxinae TaxID=2970734 RepID=UPI002867F7C4|nr:hypothetical protein [Streptomyces sp. LP05-1]